MRNQLRTQMKSESVISVQTEMYILIVITAITFFSIWSSGIQGQSQGSWWQTPSSFQLTNRNTMGHGQFCQVATVMQLSKLL